MCFAASELKDDQCLDVIISISKPIRIKKNIKSKLLIDPFIHQIIAQQKDFSFLLTLILLLRTQYLAGQLRFLEPSTSDTAHDL